MALINATHCADIVTCICITTGKERAHVKLYIYIYIVSNFC